MASDCIIHFMRDGDIRTLKSFMQDLDSIDEHIYMDDFNDLNLLHLAAGLDSVHRESIIDMLFENGADVDCPGKQESIRNITALHIAAMWGYHDTIKLLLLYGADPSLRAANGYSAIDYASVFDNYLCISQLLRYDRHDSETSVAAWSTIMDTTAEEFNDSSTDCQYVTALDVCSGDRRRATRDSLNSPSGRRSHLITILSDIAENDQDEDYDPLDDVREEDLDFAIDNTTLRRELRKLGREAGPLTNTTRRLYIKLLAKLKKDDRERVYSPRTTTKSRLNGYSVELTSIQTGKFSIKETIELEREFIRISGSTCYHSAKQYFNYILIDPRITQNLPNQAIEASDSDTSRMASPDDEAPKPKNVMGKVNRKFNPKLFTKFIQGIFYIGKGQKKRDFDHLHDALADRGSITHKKIHTIRSIWDEGYGVVSLHLFHNITDKEALTREALMIETIGLDNLTNLMRGTVQFKLDGWNEHQRKLLGALLLFRAYTQHLNEGERQLRRNDLRQTAKVKSAVDLL